MKDNRQLLIEHPVGNAKIIKSAGESASTLTEGAIPIFDMLPEGVSDESILIKGPVQRADIENKNGRIYPRPILEKEVNRLNEIIKEMGGVLGELDHPEHCHLDDYQVLTTNGFK